MKNNWLNREEYPFHSNYFEINKQQLHYIDEGTGDVILFVHGTPSWSFDFRNLIKKLRNNYRCIAIDHIGFGLSSKPYDYDYSAQNHSKTLSKFIKFLQLDLFTIVVHDFGGPIGLNIAIQQPKKIRNIVLFNSWLWSSKDDENYIKLTKILRSPLIPFLYRYFNFSAKYILPKSFGNQRLDKKLLKQYTSPFSNNKEREGTLGFAMSLLHEQDWFETLWNQKNNIEHIPILFIWGMKDSIITPNHLKKFETGFSNSKTLKLENSGHYPMEEMPETIYEEVVLFLTNPTCKSL